MENFGWSAKAHATYMAVLEYARTQPRSLTRQIPTGVHYDGNNPVGCSCSLWTVNVLYDFSYELMWGLSNEQIRIHVKLWLLRWCQGFYNFERDRYYSYAIDQARPDATRTQFMVFPKLHSEAEKILLEVFRPIYHVKTKNAAHAPFSEVWNVLLATSQIDWDKMFELIKDVK